MLTRALIIWFGILLLASVNGALRAAWFIPKLGERLSYAVSTLLLCAIVLLVTWFAIGWIGPGSVRDTVLIGVLWVAMTLAFEFLAGHYLFGHSWARLLDAEDGPLTALTIRLSPPRFAPFRHSRPMMSAPSVWKSCSARVL